MARPSPHASSNLEKHALYFARSRKNVLNTDTNGAFEFRRHNNVQILRNWAMSLFYRYPVQAYNLLGDISRNRLARTFSVQDE